ncbi:MAG: hypothetical protein H3Z54_12705 [archaeon]|nr:hypothetical protein [archaeon]
MTNKYRHQKIRNKLSLSFIIILCIFTILMFLQAPTGLATTQSDDLDDHMLQNAGFENGTYAPWLPMLVGLDGIKELNESIADRHLNVTQEYTHSGNYSLKIFNLTEDFTDGRYFGIAYEIPKPESPVLGYRLSFWVSTGDFIDMTAPSPKELKWMVGMNVTSVNEQGKIIFRTSWNPSYPVTNITSQMYWHNEWKEVTVYVPGNTVLMILHVDWKSLELVPSDAKIYIDDVSLTPFTINATTDKPNYYFGDVIITASISNYTEDIFNVELETEILMPNELIVGPMSMNEENISTYSVSWPVQMRFSLSGRYTAIVYVSANFVNWPHNESYELTVGAPTSFTVLPILPLAINMVVAVTITIAIIRSGSVKLDIFMLVILFLILLLSG